MIRATRKINNIYLTRISRTNKPKNWYSKQNNCYSKQKNCYSKNKNWYSKNKNWYSKHKDWYNKIINKMKNAIEARP